MKGLLGLVVLAVIIYSVVHGCSSSDSGDSSGGMDQMTRDFMAYDACKDAVSEQLKAPSTADFQGETSVSYSNDGSSVSIVGYVDAENSFGAKLRNDWTCTADVDSSGNVSNVDAELIDG